MTQALIKKVCGLRRPEDVGLAAQLGANALGLVFYASSPRAVRPADEPLLREVLATLAPQVQRVGVFVNASDAEILACTNRMGLDTVQLHGQEAPSQCARLRQHLTVWKALPAHDGNQLLGQFVAYAGQVDAFVLDTPSAQWGGTGQPWAWETLAAVRKQCPHPLILAGGLDGSQVPSAWQALRPDGFDASSRLESQPGHKDPVALHDYLRACEALTASAAILTPERNEHP